MSTHEERVVESPEHDARGRASVERSLGRALDRVVRWVAAVDPAAEGTSRPADPDEELVARKLQARHGATRPNTIAVMSPKGGVGKTTCAFVLGSVLASHGNQRVVIVDATPELGTLPALVPDALRSDRTCADLVADAKRIGSAAAMRPYVSCLPSGAHVLGAGPDPAVAGVLAGALYEPLVALLSMFYDVVILDTGTALATGAARFAVRAADQLVVVTTPDALSASTVLGTLDRLPAERVTVVLNMAQPGTAWDQEPIEQRLREHRVRHTTTIPFDERLLEALDNQTYDIRALDPRTRVGIMRLAVLVANRLA